VVAIFTARIGAITVMLGLQAHPLVAMDLVPPRRPLDGRGPVQVWMRRGLQDAGVVAASGEWLWAARPR
jgi:hypothetical protein